MQTEGGLVCCNDVLTTEVKQAHSALGDGASDIFKLLSAVGAYEYEGGSKAFCESNFLRVKAMEEIHKLRSQISRIVMANFPKVDAGFVPSLPPPSELQVNPPKNLRSRFTFACLSR